MVEGKIIHGLNCPNCGGMLEIEEGQTIVDCPYCDVSSLLTGEKGMWRFRVRRGVEREKALQVVRSFFAGYNKAPDLQRQAVIEECSPVYVPYWRAWARLAAWVFGRRRGEDSTYPVEKAITEDYVWTDAACDLSEFGLQSINVKEGDLELYDREALQREALVFEPVESSTEAMNRAKEEFLERARRKARLSETSFERFQFLRDKLSLVYYPLWLVRYIYQGRSYQVVVDGVTSRVLYGRAPGDPLLRAVGFVLAWLVGVTLLVDVLMLFNLGLSSSEIPPDLGQRLGLLVPVFLALLFYSLSLGLPVAGLSLALISAGYSLFRFGGERAVGEKRMLQEFWASISGGQWITKLGFAAWCGNDLSGQG